MKNIIIIGPSVERTKGGMASVIQSLMESNAAAHGYHLQHFTSHVEGSAIEKLTFFFKCFFKLLVKRDVALVHIHTACDASFYRKAIFARICRLKGIPVVMHIHGADFHTFFLNANKPIQAFIKSSLKGCDKVIVLSSYWESFFKDNMALNNVVILFNAVDHEAFNACLTVPDKINSFLFLGGLGERKGIYDLIKAIDILINQENLRQLKFYFAGDGEISKVKDIVTSLKLDDNVEVLGWVDHALKKEVLLKADTVVLPSYNEGLPVAILEAMAAGKVILSTPVGGIPDLVIEGVNGYLIAPGDVNGLVSSIKNIARHPEEMVVIAHNNLKKIEAEYSSIKINGQLFQMYDAIIRARR